MLPSTLTNKYEKHQDAPLNSSKLWYSVWYPFSKKHPVDVSDLARRGRTPGSYTPQWGRLHQHATTPAKWGFASQFDGIQIIHQWISTIKFQKSSEKKTLSGCVDVGHVSLWCCSSSRLLGWCSQSDDWQPSSFCGKTMWKSTAGYVIGEDSKLHQRSFLGFPEMGVIIPKSS